MDDNQKIAELTEAIRLNPNNAAAYANRGVAYANKKDYDRAIVDFTRALRLDPNNIRVYYFRGVAYANKRDYDRAIADLTEAVRLDPNNAASAAALAKVKAVVQKAAEPKETVRLNPNDVAAHIKSGHECFAKQDYDQAIEEFNKAIRLNPNDATLYSDRGKAYSKKGNLDGAIADFTEAIRLNPNGASVYYSRGVVYANKRDYDRAIADLTEAVRLDPNNATSVAALAKVKAAAQKVAEPKETVPLNPNDAVSVAVPAKAATLKAAEPKETIRLKANDATSAVALEETKAAAQKMAEQKETIKLKPNNATLYSDRGKASSLKGREYSGKGDYDRAIEGFNTEYKCVLAPKNLVIDHSGNYDDAVRSFADLINREVTGGWKFNRMEQVSITQTPPKTGCLRGLFILIGIAQKPTATTIQFNTLIFSKEKTSVLKAGNRVVTNDTRGY